ncbi:MAG: SCO family protein [Erythrobacter sp.]|uniref:SCO family protein n=1 Tax=Erythrobacter sp. TaxID=1042 RepID=UPI0025EAC867|nr:SCO family protein [Erythrobacter sp.]MCM0000639.1 SCO family protein [Erythrobacter sp.]
MNRINKSSAFACLTIALALVLSGCGGAGAPAAEPPLAGAAIGGDFALKNSKGETVRWGDFAGKYRIVYFGYTFCPDICPTDMQRVAQGLKALKASDPAKAGKVVPIFITIDPERDTQAVVGEFAAAFSPDIVGLTGTPEQIAATAKTFKVFYQNGEAQPGGGYLVDHSNVVYLFGPDGAPIATLPTDRGGDAVAAELARWVN